MVRFTTEVINLRWLFFATKSITNNSIYQFLIFINFRNISLFILSFFVAKIFSLLPNLSTNIVLKLKIIKKQYYYIFTRKSFKVVFVLH